MTATWPVLAVVPARGGSRGVVDKNLAVVGGQPLVARAVRAALGARYIDQVVVSTDDARIAAVARSSGADVVMRPPALSGDSATSESALLHAVDEVARRTGIPARVVVLVQCTSPFVTAADVDAVAGAVVGDQADSALTVAPFHGYLWRAGDSAPGDHGINDHGVNDHGINDHGVNDHGVNHDVAHRPRRQDRVADFLETGAAYAMTVAGLRRHGHRFFGRIASIPVDPARTLEIDDPHDLVRARALAPILDPMIMPRPGPTTDASISPARSMSVAT